MENKEYTDLLKYFITRHAIAIQLVPVDEALKVCKASITELMCKDKEYVYVIENQYGEKEVVTDRIGKLLLKFWSEIRGDYYGKY